MMDWAFSKTTISDEVHGYQITKNDRPISNEAFIYGLEAQPELQVVLLDILRHCPFEAYFWEVKPFSVNTLTDAFEFVIVNSTSLSRLRANRQPFEQYFGTSESVVSFPNLGGDAQLIVPTPQQADEIYNHLASFVRSASEEQILAFWQKVGRVCQAALRDTPLWLSTAGLGVSWLHLRLDKRPKYYRYQPYKMFS